MILSGKATVIYVQTDAGRMKALIVVDYQNDFVDGSLGFEKAKDLEGPICRKIEEYLSRKDLVLFTKDCHDHEKYADTLEGKYLPIEHCSTEKGMGIYGEVAKYADESNTIYKDRFGSEDLCARIRQYEGIESFELCGLVSSICVLSNAVLLRANFPQVPIVIDAQCTAAADESMNAKALDVMQNLQMDIINR